MSQHTGLEELHHLITRVQYPLDPQRCSAGEGGGGLQAFHADTTSAFGVNLRSLAPSLFARASLASYGEERHVRGSVRWLAACMHACKHARKQGAWKQAP
jgi:hypothetical protein